MDGEVCPSGYTVECRNDIPFGFGIGQVTVVGKTVFNIFMEPRFTILHQGVGQPAFQIFTALNMQFKSN